MNKTPKKKTMPSSSAERLAKVLPSLIPSWCPWEQDGTRFKVLTRAGWLSLSFSDADPQRRGAPPELEVFTCFEAPWLAFRLVGADGHNGKWNHHLPVTGEEGAALGRLLAPLWPCEADVPLLECLGAIQRACAAQQTEEWVFVMGEEVRVLAALLLERHPQGASLRARRSLDPHLRLRLLATAKTMRDELSGAAAAVRVVEGETVGVTRTDFEAAVAPIRRRRYLKVIGSCGHLPTYSFCEGCGTDYRGNAVRRFWRAVERFLGPDIPPALVALAESLFLRRPRDLNLYAALEQSGTQGD